MEIRIGFQRTAIVDAVDFESLSQFRWHTKRKGNVTYAHAYFVEGGKRKLISMHRIVLGVSDPNTIVDHVNGDGLDNRRSNLRVVTPHQSSCNRSSDSGTSFFKGVSWVEEKRRWRAAICSSGKTTFIGYFESELDAAKAYNEKASEIHGEFARLNRPHDPNYVSRLSAERKRRNRIQFEREKDKNNENK